MIMTAKALTATTARGANTGLARARSALTTAQEER
ncbi:Uncharacterised protein [Mycobacteroides abscessus subsp. massiliense]|nr:Uncharacterised protein [Mycobacteroides abscessus subsp. massiliense]